jgi:hypothetical protein
MIRTKLCWIEDFSVGKIEAERPSHDELSRPLSRTSPQFYQANLSGKNSAKRSS